MLNPRDVLVKLIPAEFFLPVCSALADSVDMVHQAEPNKWGLRLAKRSIMLKIGSHEVIQVLRDNWFHIIVDRDLVPEVLRRNPDQLTFTQTNYQRNHSSLGFYPSNPSSESCDFDFSLVQEVYSQLKPAHEAIIKKAARTQMLPNTKSTHSADLVDYLSLVVDRELPQPQYALRSDYASVGDVAGMSERLALYEGEAKIAQVRRYERNYLARRLCIEEHGLQCGICMFDFEKKYGAEAKGLIHVHHIRPLSEIGEQYQLNPEEDLLPVCPNCHMVIHATRPARTPEQVREMLQLAERYE